MMRVMAGLAAWAAGTVVAVSIAWFGANVVVSNAGVGPGIPVVNAAVLPPSATSGPVVTPPVVVPSSRSAPSSSSPAAKRTPAGRAVTSETPASVGGTPAPSSGADPSPSATTSAGDVHAYALTGGTVTLNLANNAVQLVTAVPEAGYSVQTWSGTGWLRVDFSSGTQVSSLIASWYEHAPTITVTN
jgi:hypothetical protein